MFCVMPVKTGIQWGRVETCPYIWLSGRSTTDCDPELPEMTFGTCPEFLFYDTRS